MNTCKLAWSISFILLITLAATSYKLIIGEPVSTLKKSSDTRQALVLKPAERDLVLAEMRMFLSSVQKITSAVGTENMQEIIKAARDVGAKAQPPTPESLAKKLPLNFKKLGRDTHKKFDLLALDAEDLGDPQHSLQQLSELMNNCVACHSTYKINIEFK